MTQTTDVYAPTILEVRSPKSRCHPKAVHSDSGRTLAGLFLASGGGHQLLAFLGLSDASLQYLSWLSHDILPVHPNFPFLIRTPVTLD